MPVQKRAADSPQSQFAEMLDAFPYSAWIEDVSGRILALARNERKVAGASCSRLGEQDALPTLEKTVFPLMLSGEHTGKMPVPRDLRLVALFPAGRETECYRDIIVALLAKALRARQAGTVDVSGEARRLKKLLARLTPQQREIYREITPGCSYKEIAARLGMSHSQILVQVNRMRKTLGEDLIPYQRKKRRQLVN